MLASGEQVVASETENPDLFWAIRGAGQVKLKAGLRETRNDELMGKIELRRRDSLHVPRL